MAGKFTPYSAPKATQAEATMRRIITELQKDILAYNVVDCEIDGDTTVAHGLTRQPIGWFIIDIQDAGPVIRKSWDSSNLVLNAPALTRCRIYIF